MYCHEYHIQFNNIFLTLTDEKFEKFVGYLKEINENEPLIEEHEFVSDKNIILPILHPYMVVLINIEELRMLKVNFNHFGFNFIRRFSI